MNHTGAHGDRSGHYVGHGLRHLLDANSVTVHLSGEGHRGPPTRGELGGAGAQPVGSGAAQAGARPARPRPRKQPEAPATRPGLRNTSRDELAEWYPNSGYHEKQRRQLALMLGCHLWLKTGNSRRPVGHTECRILSVFHNAGFWDKLYIWKGYGTAIAVVRPTPTTGPTENHRHGWGGGGEGVGWAWALVSSNPRKFIPSEHFIRSAAECFIITAE